MCRGSVIIELVSRMKSTWMLGVPEIEEKLFFRERFDAKYLHQVSYLLDACVHLTAVYPVQRVSVIIRYITTSPLLLSTSQRVYLS